MNANTSRQSPAEWDESDELLSRTARDLPTGRHQFHKERLMAQIHDTQQQDSRTATPAKARRFRLPRPAFALPAMVAAAAGAVVVATVLGPGGGGVRDGGVATGPALTTEIGAASTSGLPQLLDQISLAAADTSTRTSGPASSSTSSPRRPTRSSRPSTTSPSWPAMNCTRVRSGSPRTASRAG